MIHTPSFCFRPFTDPLKSTLKVTFHSRVPDFGKDSLIEEALWPVKLRKQYRLNCRLLVRIPFESDTFSNIQPHYVTTKCEIIRLLNCLKKWKDCRGNVQWSRETLLIFLQRLLQ